MEPRYEHSAGHQSMISGNVVVNGGNFTQNIAGQERKPPFEILQENVAHTAFHNSRARFDPPKCHPNTRRAVLKKIMDWMHRADRELWYRYIMWLTGAAGAGKSAIAQSIIELCLVEGLIIASFFFFRSDPTRNHGKFFVATLAYQIFFSLPTMQQDISLAIHNDPLIFTRSLSHQFDTLVIQPLRRFYALLNTLEEKWRRVIVIDGLDECLDRDTQKQILTMLRDAIRKYELPVVFLVASRPEHDITTVFNSKPMNGVFFRLYLDEEFSPDDDIRLYLRDSFEEIKTTHPFKAYIPASWPSDNTLTEIVRKSSGQFIYAATIFRYCQSTRHLPHQRLDVVNNLRPAQGDLPFTQLDALYTMILDSAADTRRIRYMFSIFSHRVCNDVVNFDISSFMLLEPGELEVLVCDLGAIVSIGTHFLGWGLVRGVDFVNILHKSLLDFFLDPVRSGDYFLDIDTYRSEHVANIIQYVIKDPRRNDINMFRDFITRELPLCQSTTSLINIAGKFSIPSLLLDEIDFRKSNRTNRDNYHTGKLDLGKFVFWFWLPFCVRMATLDERWAVIEKKHREHVEWVFWDQMPDYCKNDDLILVLCIACHLGNDMFVPIISDSDYYPLYRIHGYDTLYLWESFELEDGKDQHFQHFQHFLQHPDKSGGYAIGLSTYAKAALKCVELLALTPVLYGNNEDKLSNALTIDDGRWTLGTNPISNENFLVLGYIIFFLPRAAFYEPLVKHCQQQTFLIEELTTAYPIRTALVRQEMKNYLERVQAGAPGSL